MERRGSEWYEEKMRNEFSLGGFLYDTHSITMEEFELSLEMRDISNKAFHDDERSIE